MWLCKKKKREGGGVHVTAVSTLSGHDQPVVCFLSPRFWKWEHLEEAKIC